jgi:hypothetical protein
VALQVSDILLKLLIRTFQVLGWVKCRWTNVLSGAQRMALSIRLADIMSYK